MKTDLHKFKGRAVRAGSRQRIPIENISKDVEGISGVTSVILQHKQYGDSTATPT